MNQSDGKRATRFPILAGRFVAGLFASLVLSCATDNASQQATPLITANAVATVPVSSTFPQLNEWQRMSVTSYFRSGDGNSDPCLRHFANRFHLWWSQNGKLIMYSTTSDPTAVNGWTRPVVAARGSGEGTSSGQGLEVANVLPWNGIYLMWALQKPGQGHVNQSVDGIWRAFAVHLATNPGGPFSAGIPCIFPSQQWAQPYVNPQTNRLTGGLTEIAVCIDGVFLRAWPLANVGDDAVKGWGHRMGHAWSLDGINWRQDRNPVYVERGDVQGAPAKWTWMQHDIVKHRGRWLGVGKPQWESLVAIASEDGLSNWVELGEFRKYDPVNPWKGQFNGPTACTNDAGRLFICVMVGPQRGRFDRATFEVAAEKL